MTPCRHAGRFPMAIVRNLWITRMTLQRAFCAVFFSGISVTMVT
nr:MAG TPA: hypothetical protein [Caudoviricetes sp.]